jgi:hypothetical protein
MEISDPRSFFAFNWSFDQAFYNVYHNHAGVRSCQELQKVEEAMYIWDYVLSNDQKAELNRLYEKSLIMSHRI